VSTDCVWSGRVGTVACWELRDEAGQVVGRVAAAPRTDSAIPQEIVRKHPQAYHQSTIGAGPGFVEQHPYSYDEKLIRDGPHFNGYILGDDLVGYVNVGRGARLLLLVATFPGASIADYDGYWDGEALPACTSPKPDRSRAPTRPGVAMTPSGALTRSYQ
jgi:hypothetical protein